MKWNAQNLTLLTYWLIAKHCLITLPQDLYAATNPPYSDDKDRQRGYNDVLDTKPSINHLSSNSWSKECSPSALQAMGNRLLDWFSVVMAEAKRRRTHNKGKGILWSSEFQMKPAFVNEEGKCSSCTLTSYVSL